jgi:hypothetical protein
MLFSSIVLMGFLQFIAMVSTGMMMISPNEITIVHGSNFLPITNCPNQIECKGGGCYARSFTFTPKIGSCADLINGSKSENIYKIIRPAKDSFKKNDDSYINGKDTCCVHWNDDNTHERLSEKQRTRTAQPFEQLLMVIWLFMALLATLMVLIDFFRAMYETCGVQEWVGARLQSRLGNTVKNGMAKITPSTLKVVEGKVDEKVDEGSAKAAQKLLTIGGYLLGGIVYFGMAFPLNQLIGNMIRVGDTVSVPADTLMSGQEGGKYGVWEPVSESFLVAVIESIGGALGSSVALFFLGGPIYALVMFYYALRLIGIEETPRCHKDSKIDLTRTCRFLACFFPMGCLIGIGIIILYFRMYFTANLSLPTLLFGMPSFSLPRLGFEIPNFPALSIGISLCFATLIRLILSCCKCKKKCFSIAVKVGCCKPSCKIPGVSDMKDKQCVELLFLLCPSSFFSLLFFLTVNVVTLPLFFFLSLFALSDLAR